MAIDSPDKTDKLPFIIERNPSEDEIEEFNKLTGHPGHDFRMAEKVNGKDQPVFVRLLYREDGSVGGCKILPPDEDALLTEDQALIAERRDTEERYGDIDVSEVGLDFLLTDDGTTLVCLNLTQPMVPGVNNAELFKRETVHYLRVIGKKLAPKLLAGESSIRK